MRLVLTIETGDEPLDDSATGMRELCRILLAAAANIEIHGLGHEDTLALEDFNGTPVGDVHWEPSSWKVGDLAWEAFAHRRVVVSDVEPVEDGYQLVSIRDAFTSEPRGQHWVDLGGRTTSGEARISRREQ